MTSMTWSVPPSLRAHLAQVAIAPPSLSHWPVWSLRTLWGGLTKPSTDRAGCLVLVPGGCEAGQLCSAWAPPS